MVTKEVLGSAITLLRGGPNIHCGILFLQSNVEDVAALMRRRAEEVLYGDAVSKESLGKWLNQREADEIFSTGIAIPNTQINVYCFLVM